MTDSATISIGPLQPGDGQAIAHILMPYARDEILLWRTPEDIEAHRPDFLVARAGETVVGCVALRDYGGGLEEVRSLAVHPDWTGKGIGAELVRAAVDFARERQADLVFALTRIDEWFVRQGFHRVPKAAFPEKVFKDCELCRRRDRCNEVAVCRQLAGEDLPHPE